MFGYILPEKPELKIKEYEVFRAYYCGVCKSIGKSFGQLVRITLTYDSTFLALLLSSLAGEDMRLCKERCIVHPVNKRLAVRNSSFLEYAAEMNILLAYYKLKDDWEDEKHPLSLVASAAFKGAYAKLYGKHREKCGIIEQCLKELHFLEKQCCASMDRAAEPFGRLMEEITACHELCSNKSTERVLRRMGYNIGRWIYIIDAYDDIEKDIKHKSYNPLLFQYNFNGEPVKEFKKRIRDRVEFSLTYTLSELAKTFELLDFKQNRGIIENIVYMGMLRKTEEVIRGADTPWN
ncbi:MAG: DUF5685 family protein [Clostridia bacterium]|nr:DUF5685 family protein [Clostridia bacterium]